MTGIGRLLTGCALAAALPALAAAQDIEADVIPLGGWDYEGLYANGVSVDNLLDADVIGPTGDEIGDIENVLFDADGKALSVIAEIGGFIDIGDTHVNIPWDDLEISVDGDEVKIPVTKDTIEDYTLFRDGFLTADEVSGEIEKVGGDGVGKVDTAPRVWRARELIGDYARLTGGDETVNYGYVDDIIVQDGKIAAVVVTPDVTWGYGYYAYPFYGRGWGWGPAYGTYDLPYDRDEIAELQPFDYEAFDN